MSEAANISLSGLQASTARFAASARRVAGDPEADLAKELVAQKIAEHDFKANLTVLKSVNEMSKELLDILA